MTSSFSAQRLLSELKKNGLNTLFFHSPALEIRLQTLRAYSHRINSVCFESYMARYYRPIKLRRSESETTAIFTTKIFLQTRRLWSKYTEMMYFFLFIFIDFEYQVVSFVLSWYLLSTKMF